MKPMSLWQPIAPCQKTKSGNCGFIYQTNPGGFGHGNTWLQLLFVYKKKTKTKTSKCLFLCVLISALWGVRDEGGKQSSSLQGQIFGFIDPEEVNWLLSVRGGVGGKHLTADRQTLALQGRAGSTLLDIVFHRACVRQSSPVQRGKTLCFCYN